MNPMQRPDTTALLATLGPRFRPRRGYLATLLAIAILSPAPLAWGLTVYISSHVGPTVKRWGWDIKQGPNRFSTPAKASAGYVDVSANLLRIPIEPTYHNPDGSVNVALYQPDITAIKSVLAVNPEVEVFASVKLRGQDTFPEWLGAATPGWPER
ncbi:hypothetical protein Pla175_30240 [Pirellulimonas nuda]|uniref:Uncharacterized protein n=1 Tax=Pirellulimonas nuda TaxID=2528009 RepID=A0A518DDS2_9BACT|nr:hypothetical protein [Pirellulimonas nuda]QDU89631.1 hypothetical protein Pla175_30240 [Pirellulimonas nuda]